MPDLYVTPKGQWRGTQAEAARATREEGSKPGSWRAVAVPTKKSHLIAFLNNGWKGPPQQSAFEKIQAGLNDAISVAKAAAGSGRFRVYFNGRFAGVLKGDNQEAVEEVAVRLIEVRPDLSR